MYFLKSLLNGRIMLDQTRVGSLLDNTKPYGNIKIKKYLFLLYNTKDNFHKF